MGLIMSLNSAHFNYFISVTHARYPCDSQVKNKCNNGCSLHAGGLDHYLLGFAAVVM